MYNILFISHGMESNMRLRLQSTTLEISKRQEQSRKEDKNETGNTQTLHWDL